MKGDEIVRASDQHSNETVTLRKYVTKYKNMHKWMIEFSENLRVVAIKLLELTQFVLQNISIYSNFVQYCSQL